MLHLDLHPHTEATAAAGGMHHLLVHLLQVEDTAEGMHLPLVRHTEQVGTERQRMELPLVSRHLCIKEELQELVRSRTSIRRYHHHRPTRLLLLLLGTILIGMWRD